MNLGKGQYRKCCIPGWTHVGYGGMPNGFSLRIGWGRASQLRTLPLGLLLRRLDAVHGHELKTRNVPHQLVGHTPVGHDHRALDVTKHIRAIAAEQHTLDEDLGSVSRLECDVGSVLAFVPADYVSFDNGAIDVAVGVLLVV